MADRIVIDPNEERIANVLSAEADWFEANANISDGGVSQEERNQINLLRFLAAEQNVKVASYMSEGIECNAAVANAKADLFEANANISDGGVSREEQKQINNLRLSAARCDMIVASRISNNVERGAAVANAEADQFEANANIYSDGGVSREEQKQINNLRLSAAREDFKVASHMSEGVEKDAAFANAEADRFEASANISHGGVSREEQKHINNLRLSAARCDLIVALGGISRFAPK